MTDQILQLPLSQLRVSSSNTRKNIDAGQEDSSVTGLAQSIRERGVLNPISVRQLADGSYEILAGQRRYLACKLLNMSTIPAIVRAVTADTDAVALSLIENVQRADMHPLDKAEAYQQLREQYQGNLRRVSEATGVGVATIQRYLELLRLPPELREELGTGKGSAGVGAMATIAKTFSSPGDMVKAFNEIGGFTQDIQTEILRRSGGRIEDVPGLKQQALEGAFDVSTCGSSAADCPHIPDELRVPLLHAIEALKSKQDEPARSLKDFAARHKKKKP